MERNERLRSELAKIVADTIGKESGRLYFDFYKDDDEESIINGAKALLMVMLGPEMTDKKIEQALHKL